MKKYKVMMPLFCILSIVLLFHPIAVRAGDFDGLKRVKAVWDVTVDNGESFENKLALIKHTADTLRKRGVRPIFVVALNGPAAKFAAKTLGGTRHAGEKIENLSDIQEKMKELHTSGVVFMTCKISLKQGKIEESALLPFVRIGENVLANIAALQNKGYAYMPVR